MTNEKEFYIGQVFKGIYPPELSVWCAENGATVRKQEDNSFIIEKYVEPEKSLEQKVIDLEQKYSMYRWRRTHILNNKEQYDEWTISRAQEIENMALPLRKENKSSL